MVENQLDAFVEHPKLLLNAFLIHAEHVRHSRGGLIAFGFRALKVLCLEVDVRTHFGQGNGLHGDVVADGFTAQFRCLGNRGGDHHKGQRVDEDGGPGAEKIGRVRLIGHAPTTCAGPGILAK